MLVTIDTNVLHVDPLLKGAGATATRRAAAQFGFDFAITEVVLAEAQGKFMERIEKAQGKLRALSQELSALGLDSVLSMPSQPEMDEIARTYRTTLESIFPQSMRLAFPDIPLQVLVERAVLKRRPFREEDRGFRDTLIWLSLLAHLKSSGDSIVFITNDEGFYRDKGTNDVHPDLMSDLAQDDIQPERFVLYHSMNEFVEESVSPKLQSMEEIRAGIESGSIKLPDDIEDTVATNLWEYSIGIEFDPDELGFGGAFAAEVDVIQDVTLHEVESAVLLDDEILLRCMWKGEITLIVHSPGYQRDSVDKPFQALLEMILNRDTLELVTMDVLEFELVEPSYY